MNNNESFRDDLAARLASVMPPEQLAILLHLDCQLIIKTLSIAQVHLMDHFLHGRLITGHIRLQPTRQQTSSSGIK